MTALPAPSTILPPAMAAAKRADINGKGSQREVRLFAHELRKNVWKKLFGITGGVRPATELQQAIEQPGLPSSWRAIQQRAEANAKLYEAAFPWIPRNERLNSRNQSQDAKILPTWDEPKKSLSSPMPFQQEFWSSPQQISAGVGGLANIKGFITALPINWTRDENLHYQYPTDLVADNGKAQVDTDASALIAQSNRKPTSPTNALSCGFNWSMQHNDRLWRKECWHEAKTADLLHRSSEGPDVGSLESWRYPARDRQAV